VAPIAFAFVLYTIYGVGAEVVLWGFLILLAGTPLYIWFATRDGASPDAPRVSP
jgi:APA family basic amino acid/polyamine antiporter